MAIILTVQALSPAPPAPVSHQSSTAAAVRRHDSALKQSRQSGGSARGRYQAEEEDHVTQASSVDWG